MNGDEQPEDEKLLNPRQAAEFLGVSVRTLARITSPRGPLQAVRFGSQVVRFRRDDLRQFIAAHVA